METNQSYRRLVDYLRLHIPSTRQDICNDLHVSRSTLLPMLKVLIDRGIINETLSRDSRRGRPLHYLALDTKRPCSLGIELQADSTYAVVLSADHTVLLSRFISLTGQDTWEDRIKAIMEQVNKALPELGYSLYDLQCIGIGLPGPVPTISVGNFTSRAAEAKKGALAALRTQNITTSVFTNNSVRLAAYGESNNHGIENALYVRISDGIGASFIVDSDFYAGECGLSGELGHWTVCGRNTPCFCGKTGCLETVGNTRALCKLAGVEELGELVSAWRNNSCRAEINQAMTTVGQVIGQATLLWNTSNVILAGTVLHYLPELFPLLEQAIRSELIPQIRPLVRISTGMSGLFAGALGAALWAYHQQLSCL